MPEYIERDSLIGIFLNRKFKDNSSSKIEYGEVIRIINSQPTADVQEVRHGKWEMRKVNDKTNEDRCSLCGYSYFTNRRGFNHCPNCGAKMDKE